MTLINGALNLIEWGLGNVSELRDALGDWADSGNGSTYGDTGINSYENDVYFQDFIKGLTKKGYGERFTEEQFYDIFGASADALVPTGNDLLSTSLVGQYLLSDYFGSDRYALDVASGYSTVDSAKEIFDLMANGGESARLGLNVSDTYMAGYKAMMGIAPGMELTDAMNQQLRMMAIREQLAETDRAAWAEQTQAVMEYGYAIEDVNGKLFSFDQAEVLGGKSTNIPDFGDWGNALDGNKEAVLDSIMDISNAAGIYGQDAGQNYGKGLTAGIDNALGIARGKMQRFSKDVAGYLNVTSTGVLGGVKYTSGEPVDVSYPMITLGSGGTKSESTYINYAELFPNLSRVDEQLATLHDIASRSAVALPLDSPTVASAIASDLVKAGADSQAGNKYDIHMHLEGVNIADNDRSWNMVANKIKDTLNLREQRGG